MPCALVHLLVASAASYLLFANAHEPGLLSVVGRWGDRWDEYQAALDLIRVQLQTSLEEAGFSEAQAGEFAPELFRQVARSLLLHVPLPDPKLVDTS